MTHGAARWVKAWAASGVLGVALGVSPALAWGMEVPDAAATFATVEPPSSAPEDATAPAPERAALEAPSAPSSGVGLRPIRLVLAGTSTWRTYCAAPGVRTCAEYPGLAPHARADGRAIHFTTAIPYTGGAAQLELFPLVLLGETPLQGLGLLVELGWSGSTVSLSYQTGEGEVEGGVIQSADRRLAVMATYRYFFAFRGAQATLPTYAGLRVGYLARHFLVGAAAREQLPGSRRGPLAVGVDASVTLKRLLRLEASGLYLFLSQPDEEVRRLFGEQVASRGFGVELGLAGDITGPLGYELRFRLLRFHDRFTGAGRDWLGGGVADEVYSGLSWGLTLAF